MSTVLHDEVAAVARNLPAMVIKEEVLREMVLASLSRAATFGVLSLPIPTGHAAVIAYVESLSVQPHQFSAELLSTTEGPIVRIGPPFVMVIVLHEPNSKLKYASVNITVGDIALALRGRDDRLTFDFPSLTINAVIVESPERAAAIAATSAANPITPEDLLRVEGTLAFGNAERIIRSAIGTIRPLDLAAMFPAFRFSGTLDLHVIHGALVVIPERFEMLGVSGCAIGDVTRGVTATVEKPDDQSDPDSSWGVRINSAIQERPINNREGMVSAYLPTTLLSLHFGSTKPGANYHESDNGFVGWDLKLSTSIVDVNVSLDTAMMGIRLALRFEVSGVLLVTIDVPCLGRQQLAQALFSMPKQGQSSTINVLVRPAIDFSGKLMLLSEIESADMGESEVSIQLFEKYLGYFGPGGQINGFIMDAILGRIIAHNLPSMVLQTVRNTIDRHFFVLADLSGLIQVLRHLPAEASWSNNADSALIGMTSGG